MIHADTLNKINSGQSSLRFVQLSKAKVVIKHFHNPSDFETEVGVLSHVRYCPQILQPTMQFPARREIMYLEARDGDLLSYRRESGLSYADLVGICQQIILAVGALHCAGFLHMDVKPENVVREGRLVWLIDLGLATLIHCATPNVGTPRTMSPEVLLSSICMPLTEASDWWSVGVTIFYLFSRYFKLPAEFHYGHFPYRILEDIKGNARDIEFPSDPPYAFPPALFDLLYGRHGLLSFHYANRRYAAERLLQHPFFSGICK
jgi:serine/threonine protein kinase